MPRRVSGSYLVVGRREPVGGFVAWVFGPASGISSPAGAVAAAHENQRTQGAAGVTLSPQAVFDELDRLVWGDVAGVPPSFLPRSTRRVRAA
jgi:hypothetical protein